MPRTSTAFGNNHLVIETGAARPDATTIVERKGLGHPDTLADHLAERLSRAYRRYTVRHFGAVLHHNFDKLALLGGASEVRYGGGGMTAPARVLVSGRAAPMCGGERFPSPTASARGSTATRPRWSSGMLPTTRPPNSPSTWGSTKRNPRP
ncbi:MULTISPECIES: methionine adenosyltransferase [Streptomyces]|uniref:methionine adenosyltransferase n=1 Tax=Streptomyces TaxID=1883 RepID=UPI001F043D75|nr:MULTISPECIES: methionine adenosyltransferase [Streptomyces]